MRRHLDSFPITKGLEGLYIVEVSDLLTVTTYVVQIQYSNNHYHTSTRDSRYHKTLESAQADFFERIDALFPRAA